jgi:hypothetical protein
MLTAATSLSFLFVGVLASKNGFPNTPSEATALCDLLSRLFEIIHDRPTNRGVSLRFCGLLLILRELLGVVAYECRIKLFTSGLFFYELRL